MATILGFFVGPVLGGFALGIAPAFKGTTVLAADYWPFLIGAGIALVALVLVWRHVPTASSGKSSARVGARSSSDQRTEALLLFLAAVGAAGLGVFEVGLTLRSRELGMTPLAFGSMFALCSLAMLAAQALVFSPLVPPAATRWLIAPGFAAMALGLTVVPQASGLAAILAETGLVATAAAFLTPVLAYWTSSVAGESQDAAFGRQNVAVSAGQAIGSFGAGLLFGVISIPDAPFLLAAIGLGVGALSSLALAAPLGRYAAATDQGRLMGGGK
jgi:predicted MFS family arabinose efflux permease